MKNRHLFSFPIFTSVLVACGSSDTESEPELVAQEQLVFAQSNLQQMIDDQHQVNPLRGGSGTGSVTYSISDTSIATIDVATGLLNYLDDGIVTITAQKAGDDQYLPASTNYELTIDKYSREDILYFEPGPFSPTEAEFEEDMFIRPMPVKSEGITAVPTTVVQMSVNLPAQNSSFASNPNEFNPNDPFTYNTIVGFSVNDIEGNTSLFTNYYLDVSSDTQKSWILASALDNVLYNYANFDGSEPATAMTPNFGDSSLVGYGQTLAGTNNMAITTGVYGIRLNFSDEGDLVSVISPDGLDYAVDDSNIEFPTYLFSQISATGETVVRRIKVNLNYDPGSVPEFEPKIADGPFEVTLLNINGNEADELEDALISYSSSNETVATITQANDLIAIQAPGQSTITATIAEDAKYQQGSISYELTIH